MEIKFLIFFGLTLSLLNLTRNVEGGQGILCTLTWISLNKGDDLPLSLVDSGSGDFVARAQINSQWQPGRFSTATNETIVGYGGKQEIFDSFDLLSNPNECVISWLTLEDDLVNKFPVDPSQPQVFMGRGLFGEVMVGGRVEMDKLYVGLDGSEQELSSDFEILISIYQLIQVKLSHFKFTVGDAADVEAKTVKRLFGIEEMQNLISNTTIRQTVIHSDIFEEEFLLSEPNLDWMGLGGVNLNLKLWYGSPIITDSFDVSDPKALTAVLRRTREISMEREFEINSETDVQICSVSVLLNDYPIDFTATMDVEIESNSLTEEEILLVLGLTNRPIVDNDGQVIKATFKGSLNGEYLLRTTSLSTTIDQNGACSSKYT